jgi:outer membrane protein assembly factor BamB
MPPIQPPRAGAASATVALLTQHNDNNRSGLNLSETLLTTANVHVGQFGKLFTRSVDGQIYAQPLYVPNLAIPGQGTHNVVFVATMHNSVYAFDADSPAVSAPLWHVRLGPSIPLPDACFGNGHGPFHDILIEIGILSTPVIDLAAHTMYVVTATKVGASGAGHCNAGVYVHQLHALDLATGQEKYGGPANIQAAAPGSGPDSDDGVIALENMQELQRTSLLLANGRVYVAFGSYGDTDPYHGWVLAYDAHTLTQDGTFLDTPDPRSDDHYQGGIWQSGQGPVADSSGNIYVMAGNGNSTAASGGDDYSESVMKLLPRLSLADWFTPDDAVDLSSKDLDFSAGPLLIPGSHLLLVGDKAGMLYLLDTNGLGHQSSDDSGIVQRIHASVGHIHGSPVCWNGPRGTWCYVWGEQDFLKAFPLVNGHFQGGANSSGYAVAISQSTIMAPPGMPGGVLSLSANGSTPGTGILWVTMPIIGNANVQTVPGILRAFDASNLSHELWDSEMDESQDGLGALAKFAPPTIANGKVYVGTFSGVLDVYGLLHGAPATTPLGLKSAAGARHGSHGVAPAGRLPDAH